MKPVALQCVIGGSCNFRTMELEFAQALQLLELHLKYLHTLRTSDEKVDISNHEENPVEDTFEIDGTETIPSDMEVSDEAAPVVEKLQSDSADVTSVRDDRDVKYQGPKRKNHDSNPVDAFQDNFADVTLVPDDRDGVEHPVGNHHPCGGCGGTSHSSHRSSRRKFCPGWNTFCQLCNKRGHLKNVCKTTMEEPSDEFEAIEEEDNNDLTFGEIAGLVYGMSQISKEAQRMNKVKVPHMLYDQLKWTI